MDEQNNFSLTVFVSKKRPRRISFELLSSRFQRINSSNVCMKYIGNLLKFLSNLIFDQRKTSIHI